jgi:Skp family chaperone for outer membrane proteins
LLTKASSNYNLVLTTIYEQKVQPILTKIKTVIENYAKANGIKIVFTLEKIAPGLAYIDKGINITEEIVKQIKVL